MANERRESGKRRGRFSTHSDGRRCGGLTYSFAGNPKALNRCKDTIAEFFPSSNKRNGMIPKLAAFKSGAKLPDQNIVGGAPIGWQWNHIYF